MSTAATDCAVGAFAATFSNPSQSTARANARRRNVSKNLPVELLLIIFRLVYENQGIEWDKRETRYLMSASLFPYVTASVCSLWRDTMSLVPKFWSRLVILIDTPATPLSAIVSQLEWSRDCDLEIIVTRRSLDNAVKDPREHSNVISVMSVLGSHIHRIQDLRFDVAFSSSLPFFPTDFYGTATIMKNLHMECREDDGGPDPSPWVAPMGHEEFECPRLRSLIIAGRNYYEACRRDVRWTDKIMTIYSLTISHFHPKPGESFSPYELLNPLTNVADLGVLCIRDLVLHPSPDSVLPNLGMELTALRFEDIQVDTIKVINEMCIGADYPSNLSMARCRFGDVCGLGYECDGQLSLVEIDQDIAPLFELWYGNRIHVKNCPQFNDAALDVLTRLNPCADELFIQDCPNFSVSALRRLVESRLVFRDHPEPLSTRIHNLFMLGNLPSLSEEDRGWFVANVELFYYYSFRG